MKIEIKRITANDCVVLRSRILKPGYAASDCYFEEDQHDTTFHIGAILDGELMGTASFIKNLDEDLNETEVYRLRGMATCESIRGRGVGQKILVAGFDELKARKVKLLWCNAREIALSFYTKMGFSFYSEMFEIPVIGPHRKMKKSL